MVAIEPDVILPQLLGAAWLLPLASFVVICAIGTWNQLRGRTTSPISQAWCGRLAVAAIGGSFALSVYALFAIWLPHHFTAEAEGVGPAHYAGQWYTFADFAGLRLAAEYYIDALTLIMFVLVTFMSLCVHVYSAGYMHEELDEVHDENVLAVSGRESSRPGRYHRFYQYLSLFSFSMLGLVLGGNLAMVFIFWELVGACSYFLIGFYFERKAAASAATKAFIVNRVGDFGFLIGIMALWAALGTLSFGDSQSAAGPQPGMFSKLRPDAATGALVIPAEMTALATRDSDADPHRAAYWMLCVAGLGIFCGCVGKSAQVPLHIWLPDAMEGPTPVSALVHSATMVAAGVYLVGRCYPLLMPEVLLVIACVGCVTLTLGALLAAAEFDIKRVLAYSTISQLGYMMLALGLGGWVAGLLHLVTHAVFKGLLFLCSGAVIHAVHTNDLRRMGGLGRKLPAVAAAMLVGCLAIIGVGIPTTMFGLSGYYSKDAMIEQAWSFAVANPSIWYQLLSIVPIVVAGLTAFYMFRLWFSIFAGGSHIDHEPSHAMHLPWTMSATLVLLAVLAICVAWTWPVNNLSVAALLDSAEPVAARGDKVGVLMPSLVMPDEHVAHEASIRNPASLYTFAAALLGFLVAAVIYSWRWLDADELRLAFRPVLGAWQLLARPVTGLFDRLIYFCAIIIRWLALVVDRVLDRGVIDRGLDNVGTAIRQLGTSAQSLQTGRLRGYVVYIVMSTLGLFVVMSVMWKFAFAS